MAVQFYGEQFAKMLDKSSELWDNCSYSCVVFGLRELLKHASEFEGRNTETVAVFVNSAKSVVEANRLGFRRVFNVPALARVTAEDIIDSQNVDILTLTENNEFAQLGVSTLKSSESKDAIQVLDRLIGALSEKDTSSFLEILNKNGQRLLVEARSLLSLFEFSSTYRNVSKLAVDVAHYKQLSTQLSKEIAEFKDPNNKQNLSNIQEMQDKLESLELDLKSLRQSFKEANEELTQKTLSLELATTELADLRKMNEERTREFTDSAFVLREKNNEAQIELARNSTTISELEKKNVSYQQQAKEYADKYNEMVPLYNQALTTMKELEEDLIHARAEITSLKENDANLQANQLVNKLKAELEQYKSTGGAMLTVTKMLPLIGKNFAIRATKILLIKEIKHAIYMNSLAVHLNAICREQIHRLQQKTFCIVIFDMMMDKFRAAKYNKHNFYINRVPVVTSQTPSMITVANQFDVAFLSDTLKLGTYDYLIVIDRLGLGPPAVQHSSCTAYFTVDSASDVVDFNLKDMNLLIYGESSRFAGGLNIEPQADLVATSTDQRQFAFYKSNIGKQMLMKAGFFR